jgi:hypothetical protein
VFLLVHLCLLSLPRLLRQFFLDVDRYMRLTSKPLMLSAAHLLAATYLGPTAPLQINVSDRLVTAITGELRGSTSVSSALFADALKEVGTLMFTNSFRPLLEHPLLDRCLAVLNARRLLFSKAGAIPTSPAGAGGGGAISRFGGPVAPETAANLLSIPLGARTTAFSANGTPDRSGRAPRLLAQKKSSAGLAAAASAAAAAADSADVKRTPATGTLSLAVPTIAVAAAVGTGNRGAGLPLTPKSNSGSGTAGTGGAAGGGGSRIGPLRSGGSAAARFALFNRPIGNSTGTPAANATAAAVVSVPGSVQPY